MKILKYLFFLILLVVIAGTLYFAAQDGTYEISQTKQIQAPRAVVFNTVNELKSWQHWGPWQEEDPSMQFQYPNLTQGVGASYSWTGEMDGSMSTTALVPNESITQELVLQTPGGERKPQVEWTFQQMEPGGTEVQWSISGEHTLMDKAYYAFSGMDFDAQMNEMFTKGLTNLAQHIQEKISAYTINVDGVTEYSGGYYLYQTAAATAENMTQVMGRQFGSIMEFMQNNNIKQSGMPFTLYVQMNDVNGDVIMTNAIPVNERIIVPLDSNTLCDFQPATKALKTTLRGNYEHLSEAWDQSYTYLKQNELEASAQNPFEIYVTDPGEFPNPADWLTEIYIPLK
ncbi:SRPBCC family protein [Croceiramulus getboli]|nr:GyrI-like domain-containing protein [Flavobacteriaceae bacterium YJPT1-3]